MSGSRMSGVRREACAAALVLAATISQAQDVHDHAQHQDAPEEGGVIDHSAHQGAQSEAQQDHSSHADHEQHAQPTESERAHVPPDAPKHPMPDVSEERMIELMQMEDDAPYGMILLDQFEWRGIDGEDAQAWELQAYYGTDYNKLWFETEGERVDGEESGRTELLWDRIISPWWSIQSGVRHDFSEGGPSRTWAAIGLQGLAPYFFEIDAGVYVGEQGRTAALFSADYDMLITQRWVLQPEIEFELYGKDDTANGLGSGLAAAELGLRLRYEIRREFAPYIGIHWERKFGRTADLAREAREDVDEVSFVAGVRAWF
jgi:copper resistance protein B